MGVYSERRADLSVVMEGGHHVLQLVHVLLPLDHQCCPRQRSRGLSLCVQDAGCTGSDPGGRGGEGERAQH